MKARVVILPNGQFSLFIDEGTYEEAAEKLAGVIGQLQADGLQLAEIGQVEQHRHDHEHAHLHVHNEE